MNVTNWNKSCYILYYNKQIKEKNKQNKMKRSQLTHQ